MPKPSPFHSRTSAYCESMKWKHWGGYYAVCTYGICQDPEYFALRNQAGVIDVTPLFKYDVKGPDAGRFLNRVMAKPVSGLKKDRVTYLCWVDDDGFVIDDGTVTRIDEEFFRVTAAEPSLSWFQRFARNYNVTIEDVSPRIGALSLQGPYSRDILKQCADTDLDQLKFFGSVETKMNDIPVRISRTGYTGDLGYEIWVDSENAETLYDRLMETGRNFGLLPAGLDAMDTTRVEAGFIMNGVDYFSAHHCLTDLRKNTPFELGLDWTVKTQRDPFIGQAALMREEKEGSARKLVGLDIDWVEIEKVFEEYGLPPEVSNAAWRDGKPVYDQTGEWIGQATSGSWSPVLKKNLALAQVYTPFAREGAELRIEVTAEYHRHMVKATVVKAPFYDPPHKRQ